MLWDRGEVDLVADFAYVLPVTIIGDMLDIPDSDLVMFKDWSDATARASIPTFCCPRKISRAGPMRCSGSSRTSAISSPTAERHSETTSSPKLIDPKRMLGFAYPGGTDRDVHPASGCGSRDDGEPVVGRLLEVMRNPDQMAIFKDDPGVLHTGIEEMTRYVSPVHMSGRTALEDMEIGGAKVKKGEFMMLLLACANRDPAVFDDPETFNVRREENPHIGFGFGAHFCLGASLARLEAQVALPGYWVG